MIHIYIYIHAWINIHYYDLICRALPPPSSAAAAPPAVPVSLTAVPPPHRASRHGWPLWSSLGFQGRQVEHLRSSKMFQHDFAKNVVGFRCCSCGRWSF